MRLRLALLGALLSAGTTTRAFAIDLPGSFDEPPRGAGTEDTAQQGNQRFRSGVEAEAVLGSGFTSTYGLGVGARVGWTFEQGAYAGGAVTYYNGKSIGIAGQSEGAYAAFVGAEAGWKLQPRAHWEVRPYVFAGPAILQTVDANTLRTETVTRFGLQPGVLAAYRFGSAFVSGEARAHVTPSPGALTLLAGAGLSF